jgi:hypothetical protein
MVARRNFQVHYTETRTKRGVETSNGMTGGDSGTDYIMGRISNSGEPNEIMYRVLTPFQSQWICPSVDRYRIKSTFKAWHFLAIVHFAPHAILPLSGSRETQMANRTMNASKE